MRIDVHSHLVFLDYLKYLTGRHALPRGVLEGGTYFVSCAGGYRHASPLLHTDVDAKLRSMDDLGIGVSVLSHGMPGPELLGGEAADSWASRINDHLANVIAQYPDKFAAWATLGWGSAERTIAEIDRCITQLGFKGIYLFSNINQKTVDSPGFRPVFEHVARLGVPINMHPTAPMNMHGLDQRPLIPGMAFLLDTSMATVRLVMSGLFEEQPDLVLIVPHTGGFVPYIGGRVERLIDAWAPPAGWPKLPRPAHDYFGKIYIDTVAHSPEALAYCYERYGAEQLLYGTDHPFAHFDEYNVMVDNLACSEAERDLINRGNAERLLGLST